MFRQRTVFVVGAGSSCELGLPSGDGLMTLIGQHLKANQSPHGFGNDAILRPLIDKVQETHGHGWAAPMQRYRERAAKICKALPYARSIDTFLESQRHDSETVFLGKLAITQSILQAEKGSHLHDGQGDEGRNRLAKSWYPPLARILTAGRHADDVANLFANVSFIVFNYDRCLELFLLRMIRDYFGIEDDAAKVLSSATIVHAYGQVGSLVRDANYVPFGGGDGVNIRAVAEGIKTYTESADTGTAGTIKMLVQDAETIVFMGFGYLAQNMSLIGPDRGSAAKQIMGTAYEMSPQDREAVRDKMVAELGEVDMIYSGGRRIDGGRKQSFRMLFEEGTCRSLMNNNIFSLADQ